MNLSANSIVMLHGWGVDQSTWQPFIPELKKHSKLFCIDLPGFGSAPVVDDYSLDNILQIIAAQITQPSWIIGWSLGGMLAIQLAYRYPQKVLGVVSLAANAKFVADETYPHAMPVQTSDSFNNSFAANSFATLKLFSGLLAQGAEDERKFLKLIRSFMAPEAVNENWLSALQLLSQLDNRVVLPKIYQPCLHIFADKDALVPLQAAAQFRKFNPAHSTEIIKQSAHAMHWCQTVHVLNAINNFIAEQQYNRQFKIQVAKQFSRAVDTYDSADGIQRESGLLLLNEFAIDIRLSENSLVMDLGCGTGSFVSDLQSRFNLSKVVGVDISLAMLNRTKQKTSYLVGADADSLPFTNASIDLIYSNFSLQWCFDLPKLFDELHRVLKPGGQLIFTTLGQDSLQELIRAWKAVDAQEHVNPFVDKSVLSHLLAEKFSLSEIGQQKKIAKFNTLAALLKSLKAVGATHHVHSSSGLLGKSKFAQLTAAYESHRQDNMLPLTYDVIFARATK